MDTQRTEEQSQGMTDEERALQRFPSMHQATIRMREVDANEAKVRGAFQREMDNIKKYGPLDRSTERVLTEEETAETEGEEGKGRVQTERLSPEEQELRALADKGDFDTLADRITEDLEAIGASEQDINMVEYFRGVVENSKDPAWKKWAIDMCLWASKAKKQMRRT